MIRLIFAILDAMLGRQLPLFPEASAPTLREVADAVREAGLDGLPDAQARADRARYQEVRVRSALARTEGMPFKWALNPYRGCTHACEYCYARKYQRHLELGAGDEFSSVILVKQNIVEALRRELAGPQWSRETVAVGTATDPYQPIEGHYRLTRRSLEVLAESRTPASIVTKGPMVVRDIDVLREIGRRAGCRVYLSVPSVDSDAWARLEPGTARPEQRLRAVRQLTDAGIEAGVLMMPLVPGITTAPAVIERTLRAIADSGARFVGTCVARLDPGVREHFFAFLQRDYPQLVEGYERLYARNRAAPAYVREIEALVDVLRRKTGLGPPTSRDASPSGRGPAPRSADASRTATSIPGPRTAS
jgi:DNA repair photolyase